MYEKMIFNFTDLKLIESIFLFYLIIKTKYLTLIFFLLIV